MIPNTLDDSAQGRRLAKAMDSLLELPGNRVTVAALLGAAASDKPPIPIVGATVRERAGLPSWGKFIRHLSKSVNLAVDSTDDDAWVDALTKQFGPLILQDAVDDTFADYRFNVDAYEPLMMMPYIVSDVIVTTSFVHEIELAFEAVLGKDRLNVRYPLEQFKWPNDYGPGPNLIKLRGDLEHRIGPRFRWDRFRADLEKVEYKNLFRGFEAAKRPVLFFEMHLPGSPLVDVAAPVGGEAAKRFALVDKVHRESLTGWLYERQIRPIWYDPADHHVVALQAAMARSLVNPAVPTMPRTWPLGDADAKVAAENVAPPREAAPKLSRQPAPRPPLALVEAVARGECVAFIGSGLAARAGLPTWKRFVEGIVNEAEARGFMSEEEASHQRAALEDREVNAVADNAISAFVNHRDELMDYYRRASSTQEPVPKSVDLLWRIGFAGMLTTNYDDLLLRSALAPAHPQLFTPRGAESMLERLTIGGSQPFLLHLYGHLEEPETVVTAPADFQDLVRSNVAFSRCIETL